MEASKSQVTPGPLPQRDKATAFCPDSGGSKSLSDTVVSQLYLLFQFPFLNAWLIPL